jgi:hypothetical protein
VPNENTLWDLVPYTRGRGIGPAGTFPHFLPIPPSDYPLIGTQVLDFVVITDYTGDLVGPWRMIKPGGHLAIFLPDHVKPEEQCALMEPLGSWDLVFSAKALQIYKKLPHKTTHVVSCRDFKKKKTACVVRYGGMGDMIQASNVLPALKRAGYHVTMMTTPAGQDVLQHDPHVDAWFIQDTDQVPNQLLGQFWDYHRTKFDLFVNLSMSVEGRLLIMESDFRRHWPKNLIQQECNFNYMEFMNQLAGMPFAAEQRFYPSDDEKSWANYELQPLADKTVVLWSLSGSSMHKATPFVDSVIARVLMNHPDVHFILVGDHACQALEGGSWANEPRVWCRSGVYSVRQTLTLAKCVNVVVGPETGVLNAVGMEQVRKVILLSHSTEENLTKHWLNTTALVPAATPCHPCHKLHVGFGGCPVVTVNINGESCQTPACTAELSQDVIYTALRDNLIELEKAA